MYLDLLKKNVRLARPYKPVFNLTYYMYDVWSTVLGSFEGGRQHKKLNQ